MHVSINIETTFLKIISILFYGLTQLNNHFIRSIINVFKSLRRLEVKLHLRKIYFLIIYSLFMSKLILINVMNVLNFHWKILKCNFFIVNNITFFFFSTLKMALFWRKEETHCCCKAAFYWFCLVFIKDLHPAALIVWFQVCARRDFKLLIRLFIPLGASFIFTCAWSCLIFFKIIWNEKNKFFHKNIIMKNLN